MKPKNLLFTIYILLLLNASIAFGQDTWTSADGPTKYTAPTDVQTSYQNDNLGKIVFSAKRIDPAKVTANNTSHSFSMGDNIYATVFMTSCLSNYKTFTMGMTVHNADSKYFVYVYIDGIKQRYKLADAKMATEFLTKSSFTLVIKADGDDAKNTNPSFTNSLDALPPGDHKIKIEVWPGIEGSRTSQASIANGEFTITKKPSGNQTMGSFGDIEDKMKDPALENRMLLALKEYAATAGWSETYTEVKITTPDWSLLYNDMTKAILARLIGVAVKATWPDGHCIYQAFTMKQLYDGSGGYQQAVSVYATGEQVKIDCK